MSIVNHNPNKKIEAPDAGEWAPVCTDGAPARIAPGEYSGFCYDMDHYIHPRFRRRVGRLFFIVVGGPADGQKLIRYYALSDSVTPGNVFWREWVLANRGMPPRRNDRLPLSKFKNKLFRIRVATVISDQNEDTLAPCVLYSKVDGILELLASNQREEM